MIQGAGWIIVLFFRDPWARKQKECVKGPEKAALDPPPLTPSGPPPQPPLARIQANIQKYGFQHFLMENVLFFSPLSVVPPGPPSLGNHPPSPLEASPDPLGPNLTEFLNIVMYSFFEKMWFSLVP